KRRQARIGVLAQALGIWLAALVCTTHQHLGVGIQTRVEAATALDVGVLVLDVTLQRYRLGDLVPRAAVPGLALGIGVDEVAQFLLLRALERNHFRILQRRNASAQHLVGVLGTEQVALRDAPVLVAFAAELFQQTAPFGE